MVYDAKSTSSFDSPPTYEQTLALPPALESHEAAGSSSIRNDVSQPGVSGEARERSIPKILQHLFTTPPNTEPLASRESTALQAVADIPTSRKWGRMQAFDRRLEDPETLYNFLRLKALDPPQFKLQCTGAHWEQHTRTESVMENGKVVQNQRGERERVVDFEFFIDMTPLLMHANNLSNVHLYAASPMAKDPHSPAFRSGGYQSLSPSPRDDDVEAGRPARQPVLNREYTADGELASTAASAAQRLELPPPPPPKNAFKTLGEHIRKVFADPAAQRDRWRSARGLPQWASVESHPDWADATATKGKGKGRARTTGDQQPFSGGLQIGVRGEGGGAAADEGRIRLPDEAEDPAGGGPGSSVQVDDEADLARFETSLREWCELYCQDPGALKSLTLQKHIWGWDLGALNGAVKSAILSTGYQSNDLTVQWDIADTDITVRPPNAASWLVWDTPWILYPFVLLVWPLIWLWKSLSPQSGRDYPVAHASYCLKYYPALPSTYPSETVEGATSRLATMHKLHPELPAKPALQPGGPKGVHYLLGAKEGWWFREWEERIRSGVRMRYKGELLGGGGTSDEDGRALDGY